MRRRTDYIVLENFGSSSSSSGSELSLFDRSKIHRGYGAHKLSTQLNTGSALYNTGANLHIPAGQLGLGISQYIQQKNAVSHGYLQKKDVLPYLEKPSSLPWNDYSKKFYSEHWQALQKTLTPTQLDALLVVPTNQDQINQVVRPPQKVVQSVVLPFSNNIGPGNPISDARNTADSIAQGHDLHYKYATQDSDVLSADREAISQFVHEAIQGKDPVSQLQSAIGAVGLGVKHAYESVAGSVQYRKYAKSYEKRSN